MKKATSKILMAAMSLVVAIGIATGTTFAWFTSNRTVTVAAVQAEVVTGTDGLYVAIQNNDGATYTNFAAGITNEQITASVYGGQANSVKLDALTTEDKGKTLHTETISGSSTTKTFAYNASESTKNEFIEFKLKFRTTVAQKIYLATNDGTTADGHVSEIKAVGEAVTNNQVLAWKTASTYGEGITKGEKIAARAANAARVSFYDGTTAVVWSPNDDKGFKTGNLAEDYREFFLNGIESANKPASTIVNEVTTLDDEEAQQGPTAVGSATALATTALNSETGAYEAVVTVRLWIEGTDGDCLNSIFGDKLSLVLVFNSVRVA